MPTAEEVSPSGLRVAKVGGSLLDWPELGPRLREWLSRNADLPTVLIVGGGRLVDVIRSDAGVPCQRTGVGMSDPIGDAEAHWLAVRAMGVSARRVQALLRPDPNLEPLISNLQSPISNPFSHPVTFLDVEHFLRHADRKHTAPPLPESWDVTSDSIAARAAELLVADELVLLKSALPPAGSLQGAVESGYVDAYFSRAAARLSRIRCVNLRSDAFQEGDLRP